jgi:hypothetical protein
MDPSGNLMMGMLSGHEESSKFQQANEMGYKLVILLHAGFDYGRVERVRITETSKKERRTATLGCHIQNHHESGNGTMGVKKSYLVYISEK